MAADSGSLARYPAGGDLSQAGTSRRLSCWRRLGSYSRRNRLYQVFRELGRVIRTVFLLDYLSKREAARADHGYHQQGGGLQRIRKWLNFGDQGVIDTLDPGRTGEALQIQPFRRRRVGHSECHRPHSRRPRAPGEWPRRATKGSGPTQRLPDETAQALR